MLAEQALSAIPPAFCFTLLRVNVSFSFSLGSGKMKREILFSLPSRMQFTTEACCSDFLWHLGPDTCDTFSTSNPQLV